MWMSRFSKRSAADPEHKPTQRNREYLRARAAGPVGNDADRIAHDATVCLWHLG